MSDADVLQELAEWLEPVGMTLTPETLAARREAVEAIAASALPPHTLVAAAYGMFVDDAPGALIEAIRAADPTLAVSGKDALIGTLAAAAVVSRLARVDDPARTTLALLVESATFLHLTPKIARLPADGRRTVGALSKRARERLEPEAMGQAVQRLLRDADAGTQATDTTPEALLKRMKGRDAALQAVGRRTEHLLASMTARMRMLDEEIDTLWWSHTARSIGTDEPWASISPPATRAARAAAELASLLTCAPAPASTGSLLRRAIGDDADSNCTLQEFAEAVAGTTPGGRPNRLLTPISTFAGRISELEDVVAAGRLFTRTYGVDAQHRFTLLMGAEQLIRERTLGALL